MTAKRAQGKHKTKLKLDPVRGPVVALIYAWRVDEHLGYRAIAERLNTDLDRYPPPQPVEWIVSEAPTHPAAVSLDVFFAAQAITTTRQGSRSDALGPTANPHRQTGQIYRLRSHVHCTLCRRRMHGKTKRTNVYCYCQPRQRVIPEGP